MNISSKISGRTALLSLVALLTCFGFSGKANAAILPPGGGPVPPDVFAPLPGATLLADVTTPFTASTGLVSGTINAAVYSDPSNTFGAGDLDFVYQYMNNASSKDAVNRITGINFTGFLTDVGYTATGSAIPGAGGFVDGTVIPVSVDRSLGGDTVGFAFTAPNGILPGATSVTLIIETNATQFAPGSVNVIDGGVSTEPAFQPTVPDGGSAVALLGVGLTAIESVRRVLRRRVK